LSMKLSIEVIASGDDALALRQARLDSHLGSTGASESWEEYRLSGSAKLFLIEQVDGSLELQALALEEFRDLPEMSLLRVVREAN
jgi:hypothetical protein